MRLHRAAAALPIRTCIDLSGVRRARLRPGLGRERASALVCAPILAVWGSLFSGLAAGCGDDEPPGAGERSAPAAAAADLPLGDVESGVKDDGAGWGAALTCKPVPSLPQLRNPRITISIEGQTLHLRDDDGFDKVYPVGIGALDRDPRSATFGESLTYGAIHDGGTQDFAITPASIQPCKTWWTDPESGAKSPVFAGLPFMAFFRGYAVHGPIDNFRAPNGGSLRRGYVSHGCARMEAADLLEVYARIKGVPRIPVHLQREVERDPATGRRIDVAMPWIGSECQSDADCSFANGFCKQNRYAERGFCSARCTRACADRAGYPTTFCVADPDAPDQGLCVAKVVAQNADCAGSDHRVPVVAARFGQPSVTATVCLPGTRGGIGDHCFADDDCQDGNRCAGAGGDRPGLCTQDCQRACPDQPGYAATFCALEAGLGDAPACVRSCTPASGASECAGGTECVERKRANAPSRTRFACLPVSDA